LYVANPLDGHVYQVSPAGALTLFVTLPSNNDAGISHMTFDSSGNMYVTNWQINGVNKVTPAGVISTYATGTVHPTGLAFDSNGNLYVSSETATGFISKITPAGVVSTFATGLHYAEGLVFDGSGNLYVANSTYPQNSTDRSSEVDKITPDGVVSTFATGFNHPQGLAFDSSGNLYVAEYWSGTVSRVGPGGGTAKLFATGFAGTESIAFPTTTTITPTATTTTLSSDHPGGSVYGQPVTFTANVNANGPGTPAGSVDFFDTTTNTDLGTVPLAASGGQHATTFDATADFEAGWAAGNNPNGVWRYGWTTFNSGPLPLFTRHYLPAANNGLEQMWDDPNESAGFTPSVARNSGGDFNNGNVTFKAGALILHPDGPSGHDYTHVIFTAPTAGSYSLAGDFFAQQNNINVDVHVLVNGVSVFDSTITSNGISRPFSRTFGLSAGDTIDFAVGPNGNFSLHAGNTGLHATITGVPQNAVLVTSSLGAGTHNIKAAYTSNSSSFSNSATTTPLVQVVSPAPLKATGVDFGATAGAPFSCVVATFTNPDPFGTAASYTATISWGDNNTSVGTITDTGGGLFAVRGGNTYAAPGSYSVTVSVSHKLGYTTTATAKSTATVRSLGIAVRDDQTEEAGFWHNQRGQALLRSFNGGPNSTARATWLATNFANLYGANAGSHNLTGQTNAQVAMFFQGLWALGHDNVDVQVLATALNVYATTDSLGGAAARAYGFRVTAEGLGASSFNVGDKGAAFGVANRTRLNVYQLLKAVDQRAVGGVLYGGDRHLRDLAEDLYEDLNNAGD
jgi:sugar lactone lactonase YvrE